MTSGRRAKNRARTCRRYGRRPRFCLHLLQARADRFIRSSDSYKRAEALSADAYSLFEKNGVLNPEAGHRFWSEILAQGGIRPALKSFTAFRSREPAIDALLRHNGMA